MLNSKKIEVTDQVCKLHTKTLYNTKYHIKNTLGTATTSYSSDTLLILWYVIRIEINRNL